MVQLNYVIPETITKSDFPARSVKPREKIIYKPAPPLPERSKFRPIQMDLEILQPFKTDVTVPFSLLHRKKRIFQIDPHAPIPDVKLEDKMFELKLKARRERPVAVMVPQIDMDEVPEEIMFGEKSESGKGGLVASIYSSDWKKASNFAIKNSPLKSKGKQVETLFEKKDLVNKLTESVRAKAKDTVLPLEVGLTKYIPAWDRKNPVEFVDTTTIFWNNNQNIGLCGICDPQPAASGLTEEEKAELETCLKEDILRTPYALHPPGYTGYIPRLALGIQFRKKRFSKYDTFVTTAMEAQGEYSVPSK